MIEILLAHTDLARLRFAHSPARELTNSLRAWSDPRRRHIYNKWLTAVAGNLADVDMELLMALAPAGTIMQTFTQPTPAKRWAVLSEELDSILDTPAQVVRTELELMAQHREMPAVLHPLYDDPVANLPSVVGEMKKYWQAAIEPYWPRLKALVAADVSIRTEQFEIGGVARVLQGLHADLSYEGDRLCIRKPHHCSHQYDLAGAGIVLIPCVLTWPDLIVECCDVAQPSLMYPARGMAELTTTVNVAQADLLHPVVGRTRAAILASLDLPRSTTHLARDLAITPASISWHLKILKEAGLVTSQRRGQVVLYQRTAMAASLLRQAPSSTYRPEEEFLAL